MKARIRHIIALAIILFGGFLFITDKAPEVLGLNQYAFNLLFIVVLLPLSIALSGIVRKLHPEL